MALQSLDIRNRSATTFEPPSARSTLEVAKLIDVSRCIGCKACQAACLEWNDLHREPVGVNEGFYTNPKDLSDQTWTLMRFYEEQIEVVGIEPPVEPERPEREWDAEPEISTDTLQLFLKDIGRVPLLTNMRSCRASGGRTARW